jgi:hypothetical protein
MAKLSKADIVSMKFNLNEWFGDDAYIQLRQMTNNEYDEYSRIVYTNEKEFGKDGAKLASVELNKFFKSIFSGLIIDHNFTNDNNEKVSNESIVESIVKQGELVNLIFGMYADFFSKYSKKKVSKKLEKLLDSTLEDK